jgi:hypothetical protein
MHAQHRPRILEFSSYHIEPSGGLQTERFLGRSRRVWTRPLSECQRKFKRDLISQYSSQQRVLAQFPLEREPLRDALDYNFSEPPHRGKLYYENFNWGMTGGHWRRLARQAIRSIELEQT